MKLPEFLSEWPGGEIMLKGHRISLYHVMSRYKEGYSPERLHEWFPTLSLDLINKVLCFYESNRAEVDAYVTDYRVEIDRQVANTPRSVSYDELLRRFEAKQRAEIP
jgi:uncharacterized protein (DUF433 family)